MLMVVFPEDLCAADRSRCAIESEFYVREGIWKSCSCQAAKHDKEKIFSGTLCFVWHTLWPILYVLDGLLRPNTGLK